MVKPAPLYEPDHAMFGMRSYPSPAALARGEMAQITNWRLGEGLPRTRWGILKAGSNPVVNPLHATAFCIGADSVSVNGTYYAVSCWSSTGGSTAAHFYAYDLSSGAWTEWTTTDTASKYGNSAPASWDVGRAWWVVVKDNQAGGEYIVCSSGIGFPLVIKPSRAGTVNDPYAAIHEPIDVPSQTNLFATVPTFPKFFTVNDESTTTLTTGTASRFVAADQGTSPENYIRFTRDTTASTDPTRVVQFGTAVDLSDCRQLIMLHDMLVPYWWEIVKLELSEDGVSFSTVWDPENPTGKVQVPHDSSTGRFPSSDARAFTGFPLDHIAAASRNAVAYFRFTYLGSTPTTSQTWDLFGIFGSGKAPGQCFHAVTFLNGGSRSESIGLVCENILPAFCKDLGCPNLSNARIANDEALFYSYTVNFQNTSEAERNKGVDTLLLYRNDPGDPDGRFTYVTTVSLATWTPGAPGSWGYVSGSALTQRSTSDNTASTSKNEEIVAPDSSTTCIPGGVCAITLGARLVIGSGIQAGGAVSFSEEYNPFRFRKRRSSETSGTKRTLNGEVPMNFARAPVSPAGIESAYLVTDKNTYIFGGVSSSELTRFRHLFSRGTYYPASVDSEKGELYFLDTKKQVTRYGDRLELLSEYTVEDKFSALDGTTSTGQYEADGIFVNGRYFLAYATTLSLTPTSRRKATPLLWETRRDARTGREYGWMQDDPQGTTITAEFFFKKDDQLYAVSADGFIYSWDLPNQTTDQGTAFTSVLTWGLLHGEMRIPFSVKNISVVMDDCSSGSVAWTRTFRPDGSTITSSATLDVSTGQQWTEDKNLAFGTAGKGAGVGCQISGSFTVPGGTRLYGVQYEHQDEKLTATASA